MRRELDWDAVDVKNHLLYAVDSGNNRVLQFSLSDLSTPLRIYGQNSINDIKLNQGRKHSSSSLFNPTKVILGCKNDLFIVDARNNRILHYLNSNTVADAVEYRLLPVLLVPLKLLVSTLLSPQQ
eukprot:TRINITY_DN6053_c0_g2_i1.p1 TRINITY_DN6053_c0_g2~~TRINITY_DN6053_c0_g2_i1.p1  ORF type:complete len:125 (-),score=18.96 TRINITY_DN6053_c0_g2_i1:523-897(-)